LLIGTVKDDIHDIGKTLVASFFKASGFNVIDLGVDVPTATFVQAVRDHDPDLLGLSSLLTTTVKEQRNVLEALDEAGLRSRVKILVGGGAVPPDWVEEIGADGYAEDAQGAVMMAKELLGKE
jgi:methylmalonyl-CoA mutase cobalamin-binding domain/chain